MCNFKSVGILGYGNFGQFMAEGLKDFFDVFVCDKKKITSLKDGIIQTTVDEVIQKDILIISIAMNAFEDFLSQYGSKIKPSTLVIEVCSVKVKPLALLEKYLHKDVEIFGTHPLFGPESTKKVGIEGKKIAVFPLRCKYSDEIIKFLRNKLKLHIIETTPQEHDKQMAYVQALSHFISKALVEFDLPIFDSQCTKTYEYLHKAKDIVKNDSNELFHTIQNENPYAKEVRENFLKKLEEIHIDIDEDFCRNSNIQ